MLHLRHCNDSRSFFCYVCTFLLLTSPESWGFYGDSAQQVKEKQAQRDGRDAQSYVKWWSVAEAKPRSHPLRNAAAALIWTSKLICCVFQLPALQTEQETRIKKGWEIWNQRVCEQTASLEQTSISAALHGFRAVLGSHCHFLKRSHFRCVLD